MTSESRTRADGAEAREIGHSSLLFHGELHETIELCFCLPMSDRERYEESLNLTSLRDGRVLVSFDFRTVLRGAVPRDPRTLGGQDACACSDYWAQYSLILIAQHSPALPLIPTCAWPDPARARRRRATPHPQRRPLAL